MEKKLKLNKYDLILIIVCILSLGLLFIKTNKKKFGQRVNNIKNMKLYYSQGQNYGRSIFKTVPSLKINIDKSIMKKLSPKISTGILNNQIKVFKVNNNGANKKNIYNNLTSEVDNNNMLHIKVLAENIGDNKQLEAKGLQFVSTYRMHLIKKMPDKIIVKKKNPNSTYNLLQVKNERIPNNNLEAVFTGFLNIKSTFVERLLLNGNSESLNQFGQTIDSASDFKAISKPMAHNQILSAKTYIANYTNNNVQEIIYAMGYNDVFNYNPIHENSNSIIQNGSYNVVTIVQKNN